MPKILKSARTNTRQKKVQGPKPKLSKSAETKHTFKPFFLSFYYA